MFGAQVMLGYMSHVRAMKFNTTSKLKAGWARTDPRLPDVMAANGHKYAVLFCNSRRDLKALQDHPVTAALVAHSKRVSTVHVARCGGYVSSSGAGVEESVERRNFKTGGLWGGVSTMGARWLPDLMAAKGHK
jgi:hypothetical protein